jgi:TolB protein
MRQGTFSALLLALAIAAVAVAATACGSAPGGQETAKLVYSVGAEGGTQYAGLFLADDAGNHRTRLTRESQPGALDAEWSPAGDRILFESYAQEVWTIAPDGSEAEKVGTGIDANWSPDGSEIAIVKESGEMEVVTAEGGSKRTIQGEGQLFAEAAPAWSPDGRELAFEEAGLIYVLGANADKGLRALSRELRALSPLEDDFYEESPVWSPDGDRIAFIRWREPDGVSEAWIMRPDGSGRRAIARGVESVAWSFDGKSLLCEISEPAARSGVYRYPLDGSAAERIGAVRSGLLESQGRFAHRLEVGGSWSPDGRWFLSVEEDALTVSRPDGSDKRRLTAPFEEFSPDWSPDGTRIAFARVGVDGSDVYVVGADGKGEHRIVDGDEPRWSPDGTALLVSRHEKERGPLIDVVSVDPVRVQTIAAGRGAAWSPDGTRIAFVDHGKAAAKARLFTVRRDGRGLRALADALSFGDPLWTPDGGSILIAEREAGEGIRMRLRRIAADGGSGTLIAQGSDDDIGLAVSPDGLTVAFGTERGVETIALAGGQRRIIVPTDELVQDLAWSPDGEQLAYALFPWPGELWVVDADGSHRRRISKAPEAVGQFDWRPQPEAAKPER